MDVKSGKQSFATDLQIESLQAAEMHQNIHHICANKTSL